jgi:hypothetical protein
MSEQAVSASSATLTADWLEVARRAHSRRTRRLLMTVALTPLMALGALGMVVILRWATRETEWWAVMPVAIHALAILLALGAPSRGRLNSEVASFRRFLARHFADRAARVHALLRAVLVESTALFLWPFLVSLAAGTSPRWGVEFTAAVSALLVLWPAARIARAQQAESGRLARVRHDGVV